MSVKTNLYVFLLEVFCTILFTENKIVLQEIFSAGPFTCDQHFLGDLKSTEQLFFETILDRFKKVDQEIYSSLQNVTEPLQNDM